MMLETINLLYNDLDFAEDKVQVRYIKQIEKLFRCSIEYRRWVYLQNSSRTLTCPFTKISNEMDSSLLELHHHPITLYGIIEIVILNLIENDFDLNYISSYKIQNHIQDQHLLDLVPFVPLTKTYHDQYHKLEDNFLLEDNNRIEIKPEWVINLEKLELFQTYLVSPETKLFRGVNIK